ncbi:DoxX family protein [Acinetobacter larvae]|uniref:DoxX family protein n=1 Tax=Acinetobacter larvae TaxID=1789224 RepID=A0A1B2LWJ2_9GAMM|nr:DoxX family protein [Acinetobacter larvae]AOA57316.1 hypothetical protein BFG52_02380 [Acinetobacter larvae]
MLNPNVYIKKTLDHTAINSLISLLGRILVVYIFIVAGWGKITSYADTVLYMQNMGVAGSLLPLTIFVEFGGGLAILLGLQTRLAALGLAVFSVLTALIFHEGHDDAINFMKNLSMAGGLLFIALYGAGRISLDHFLEKSN